TPPGVSPPELRSRMTARNVVIAMPLHPALRDKSFRIGHMGSVNANDVISAIAALERTLKTLGAEIELGSGLKAAQETLVDLNL
ncbi:MAG: alanine--glyoxylate aminotransferase family protein, partial [Acidilobaceae archaeon]